MATRVYSYLAIEANYAVTRGGKTTYVGKRAAFRQDKVTAQLDALTLINAVPSDARLVFWVARRPGEVLYTLVSVGQGTEPLIVLRLDAPQTLAPLVVSGTRRTLAELEQANTPLGGPDSVAENLTLWMEAPGGDRWALPIGFIGHADTVAVVKASFTDVVLAVLAYRSSYRTILLLDPTGFGIPSKAQICASLRQSNDALAQMLANLLGCP